MSLEITDVNIDDVLTKNEITVIDFYADWCPPCKELGPVIDELSNEDTGAMIGKLNVMDNSASAQKYMVSSIPTIIYFKNGQEVYRSRGFVSKFVIKTKIDEIKS